MSVNISLASRVFLTGNPDQACPRCSVTGSPGNPQTGTCDRGANAGGACSTTSSTGLSPDCIPGGGDGSADLGTIGVDLSPLVTSTSTVTTPDGLFCEGQVAMNDNQGCFGETSCRTIEVDGLPAGPLEPGTAQPVLLASTFCIPKVNDLVIDGAASLPGPGAVTLPAQVTLRQQAATTTSTTLVGNTTSTSTSVTSSTAVTSTSTSTTATSSTTSTTILPPLLPLTVEFASTAGTGNCGTTRNAAGQVLDDLACGDLALGNGIGAIPPSGLPDGAVVHFGLGGCSLLTCALTAVEEAGEGFDCTDTGCYFGPPVPLPNGALSACSVNTFSAPAGGSVNLLTGAVSATAPLSLHVFLTGNAAAPCPRCSATGAPGAIGVGTCDRGANAGGVCRTTNSQGLSRDCQPGGSDGSIDVGFISASLAPTTGTATASNPSGLFCPGQTSPGCFGQATCRSITETGMAPGVSILSAVTPQAATLASVFCVPATGNPVLDGPAGLPGPAAISLPGTVRSQL
jgi:hypothetical protein